MLYLSHYFKKHRAEYYERLQAIRDDGAWEEWLMFFLRGVIEVSKQATETARRVFSLRETHRQLVTDNLARTAANGHRVLEYLYQHPIISVSDAQELMGTSYPAANGLIERFRELELIEEFTGRARNRRFRYTPYIDLFSDDRT